MEKAITLSGKQIVLIGLGFLGWVAVYLFQDFDFTRLEMRYSQYAQGRIPENEEWRFVVNKSMRFLFNDLFSLLVIYGLFPEKRKLKIALLVMAFGFFILLPAYLSLAVIYKGEGFNLLVFLHRLTMNPWLMILLIPAFYYGKVREQETKSSGPE